MVEPHLDRRCGGCPCQKLSADVLLMPSIKMWGVTHFEIRVLFSFRLASDQNDRPPWRTLFANVKSFAALGHAISS